MSSHVASYRPTGCQMINSLELHRFRCFDSEKLTDCRRINVIVGENGSGKTTLLESLFLVTAQSPEIAFRLRSWRGFESSGMQGRQKDINKAIWGDLFYNFDTTKNISINARGTAEHTRRLTLTYDETETYVGMSGDLRELSFPAPVSFRWNISGRKPITIRPIFEEGKIKIPPSGDLTTETFFFPSNHIYSATENANRLSVLSRTFKDTEVIAQFNELVLKFDQRNQQIEDLSVELQVSQPMVYAKLASFAEKVPLALVGTGFNKLASLLLAIPTAPKCVVLIDEIENGFYYRRLGSIWRALLGFCKAYDAQIFATTHSRECLEAAAEVAESDPEEFSIIHAGTGGRLRQFDGRRFLDALDENIEIR